MSFRKAARGEGRACADRVTGGYYCRGHGRGGTKGNGGRDVVCGATNGVSSFWTGRTIINQRDEATGEFDDDCARDVRADNIISR